MKMPSRRKQVGFTLIEVMGALTIGAGMMAVAAYEYSRWMDSRQLTNASEHMMQIGEAFSDYISENAATIIDAGGVQTYQVADLISAGYLSTGFNNMNSYQHAL